jgi:hypothetical protein
MHTYSPNKLNKFKQTLFARKLMATVFWERKGVLMTEFMQQGTITTSEVCCKILKKCIGPTIQNKRCGMLISGVVLLHDNACPHTAAPTEALLEHFFLIVCFVNSSPEVTF